MKYLSRGLTVGLFVAVGWLCADIAPGDPGWPQSYPDWWYNAADPANGIIDATRPILNQNNDAVLNQGQLWNMADIGIQELDEQLGPVGGAGFTIDDFRDPTKTPSYYSPAAIGQLKYVVSKFYDRFAAIGYQPGSVGWNANIVLDEGAGDNSLLYPWKDDQTPENMSIALIGQAKHTFAWDLNEWTNADTENSGTGDGIPDYWELYWFGDLSAVSEGDNDGDRVINSNEFLYGTNPLLGEDLNGNQIPDDWELYWKDVVAIFYPNLDEKLDWGQSQARDLYVNNDTVGSANFTVTLNAPNAEGYVWEDSVTGSAIFSWTDISGTGTELTTIADDDNDSEMLTLTQFSFPYFGRDHTEIWISTNGYVYFQQEYNTSSNNPLPYTSGAYGKIAAFWDDLDTGRNGTIYYEESATKLIVQYEAVAKDDGSGNNTFQIVLHSNGEIEFFYKQLDGDTDESTIGIQNVSRNQGIMIADDEAYLQNSLAVKFTTSKPLLALTPLNGSVASESNQLLSLFIDTENITPATYTGSITVAHTGIGTSPWTFPYDFEVPYAKLTQPAAGLVLLEGDDLNTSTTQLKAEVHDTPDDINEVEFYADSTYIGRDTGPSNGNIYYRSWSDLPAGEHNLYARVVLDNTATQDSRTIPLTVLADANQNRIDDSWELERFNGLLVEASGDADGDRYPNIFEYHHGTDPNDDQEFPEYKLIQNTVSPVTAIGTVHYYKVDSSLATETTYEKKTIQAALNLAGDFDIIEVLPGTYNEDIRVEERVFLFGRDYARATIIDGTNRSDSVVDFSSEGVIDGFTIQNGGSTKNLSNGAGMYVSAGSNQTDLRVIGCLFVNNEASSRGGAVYVSSGDIAFVSCSLTDNLSPEGAAIFSGSNSNDIRLINTLLWNYALTNGDEVEGSINGVSYQKTLHRDSLSGNVFIDADNQNTKNPGITPYYGIYHSSPAKDAGIETEHSITDFDGEVRDDGSIDIGVDEAVDTNGDGVAEAWMAFYGFTDPSANTDTDTLVHLQEYQYQTNPVNGDTDGDSVNDSDEIFVTGTNPLVADTEDLDTDLNKDGIDDSIGLAMGISLTEDNNDGDTLTNAEELALGTNPNLSDTDGDGVDDGLDEFPLDPFMSARSTDAGDISSPVINLQQPPQAIAL
ncbi:MAG: nidogen-like domain-containing protein [Verrucomicrobiota bacterium]